MTTEKTASPGPTPQAGSAVGTAAIEGLPDGLHGLLAKPDGGFELARKLPTAFKPQDIVPAGKAQNAWQEVGLFYLFGRRVPEAISIFAAMYSHYLKAQEGSAKRSSKGLPLVWLSECYFFMGYEITWRRYLMLSLIEDAIQDKGRVDPSRGVYPRVISRGFLPEAEITRYATNAYRLFQRNRDVAKYPEAVLQQLDQNWITQAPSAPEAGVYLANTKYIEHLLSSLGNGSDGKTLEVLAEYVLSCMPGCRTQRRKRTPSTDYDVVCSMEGLEMDFRSELGRYFLCECKDWSTPANFTTMAKFCRVLDSVKARFGILFSKSGISGEETTVNAKREQLKIFQDRGMVIVVLDRGDLDRLAEGANLISLLRNKYEKVRLDLS
jgi:hypothetical protein